MKLKINDFREMGRRDFAKEFKGLTVIQMKDILNDYGIWVKSKLKSEEIQDLFLDVVDGIVEPTKNDVRKLDSRKLKSLKGIKVDIHKLFILFRSCDFDIEVLKEFNEFALNEDRKNILKETKYLNEAIFIEHDYKKMDKIARDIYRVIHPDVIINNGDMIEYSKYFSLYKEYLDDLSWWVKEFSKDKANGRDQVTDVSDKMFIPKLIEEARVINNVLGLNVDYGFAEVQIDFEDEIEKEYMY